MKAIRFLAAAVIALTATTAMAQGGPPGGAPQGGGQAMAQRTMEMLFQGITLTDEQKGKVDEVMKGSQAESRKLMEDAQASGGDPRSPEMRAKRTEISNKRNEAIKAILTAEQKPVFEKNLADMQAMMQQRQRPPR